jgi:hypothetical protein
MAFSIWTFLLLVPCLALHPLASTPASDKQRDGSKAPSVWTETCRSYFESAVEDWNLRHSDDPLPKPRVTVKKSADKMGFPMISVSQWFFQKTGSGSAEVIWREPWTTPLSDKIWPPAIVPRKEGGSFFHIVRSSRSAPESGKWFPPGSMRGSISTFVGDERDRQLLELFRPVVEACVRH